MSKAERTVSRARRYRQASSVFAALGDPTRLSLVAALADGDGPRSIARLAAGRAVTRQAITKHLRVLADAGLVAAQRAGRETHFALRPDALAEANAYLAEVGRFWEDALGRLKSFVEEGGA